jgi:chromosome segregation ATPase
MEEDEAASQGAPFQIREPVRQQPAKPVSIDPALDSMASQLENEIRQQNGAIRSLLENLKHLEGSQLPNMASTLQTLRTSIERIVIAEIPNAIKPIEDDATRVRQKFDRFSSETQGKLQNLHEKLAETSVAISQLLARYEDLSESTRTSVSTIDADLQRSKETLERASQRLTNLETGLQQADSILRSLKTEIQSLSRAFTDKVTQFQSETGSTFTQASSSLSQELKSEKSIRIQTMNRIDEQIKEVYRNTTDAVNRLTSFLATTKAQYQQALTQLARSAKDSLIVCGTAATDGFDQLSERMDQFVNDSNSQFESLENDVTSTIQALRQHIVSAREGLETAITTVSRARVNGETEIVARYDQLKSSLSQQLKQQAQHMENVAESAVQTVMDHCEKTVNTIRDELSQVRGQIERLARLESRISQLNAAAEQTRAQLVEQIGALSQRYSDLLSTIDRVEREFNSKQESIDSRLTVLESEDNQPNYATKAELAEIAGRTQAMFDGRLQEIEGQIGRVFQSISELTMAARKKGRKAVGGVVDLLSELAAQEGK